MLVLTRKNRESVVIGRSEDLTILLEITILGIEAGRVRLGFQGDHGTPIHRREVWDRICNGPADRRPFALPVAKDGLLATQLHGEQP